MPPQPPWLVGTKRGADELHQPLAEGAKSLRAGEKGGKKGGKKGKSGKGRQQPDGQPGASSWDGSSPDWPAENDWWNRQWTEGDWGEGEQAASAESKP